MNTQIYNNIRQYIKEIIAGTEFENNVFAVGGCCRDEILGLPIKDLDIVVSLENGGIRFAEWLQENRYTKGSVVTYPRFGTAMFKLKKFPEEDIEVVQTRTEIYDDNSRKPKTAYGSLVEDCQRRDLTINAIYYDISNEKMLDVCGTSFDDIKNHIIKTPCEPDKTYIDDPLRILRCIRFSRRFGWNIDSDVYNSMCNNIDRLSIISHERIADEFFKIMKHGVSNGLCSLNLIGAVKYIFPDLNIIFPDLNTNNILKSLELVSGNDMYIYMGVIGMFNKEYMERDMSEYLKMNNSDIKHIMKLISLTDELHNTKNNETEIRRFVYNCKNTETYNNVLEIYRYVYGQIPVIDINRYMDMFEYKLPINGNDIMEILGIKPGIAVKNIISELMEYVFENGVTDKVELINKVVNNHKIILN